MFVLADKEILKSIRERAVLKAQEKSAADSKTRAEKKQQENKYTLEKMMKVECNYAIDVYCFCCGKALVPFAHLTLKYTYFTPLQIEEEQRNNIEKLKADERERVTAELEAWKLQQKRETEKGEARKNRQTQEQKIQLNHTSLLTPTKNTGTTKCNILAKIC